MRASCETLGVPHQVTGGTTLNELEELAAAMHMPSCPGAAG